MLTSHEKLHLVIRYWLQGKGFHLALRAMDYGQSHHKGVRKDGVTPEFSHQIWIANLLRTLEGSVQDLEIVLAVAFLHDVPEDYDVSFEEIASRFGTAVAAPVRLLTKKHRGVVIPAPDYYAAIGGCRTAALVKGGDRIHNLGTMVGVFTREKQQAYIAEVREFILPALKRARRSFPEHEPAYENLKQALISRIDLIEAIHAAAILPDVA